MRFTILFSRLISIILVTVFLFSGVAAYAAEVPAEPVVEETARPEPTVTPDPGQGDVLAPDGTPSPEASPNPGEDPEEGKDKPTGRKCYTVKKVKLYKARKTGARVLKSIRKNEEVYEISVRGEWSKVKYKKKTGYIKTKFLTSEAPAPVEGEINVDVLGEIGEPGGLTELDKSKKQASNWAGQIVLGEGGMSIPQLANPYFVSVMNGVQAKCDELGYKLIVVDAGYDVAKQVSDFENFGNQGVDALIACPIDSNALIPVVDQLKEKGVIVISFAQIIDNANAILTLDEYTYGVAIGENAAKWINEKLGGKAQVLIISQDNVEAVVQRGNGIQETIEKLCPEAEIVARQAGDNPTKGMEITENIMQQYPDLKVITGNNDSGPLGAYEAILGMGKASEDFYIGGGDATPEAIAKMKEEGSVYRATVDLGPYDTGLEAVNFIADFIANGVPAEAPVSYFRMIPVWQEDVLSGAFPAK